VFAGEVIVTKRLLDSWQVSIPKAVNVGTPEQAAESIYSVVSSKAGLLLKKRQRILDDLRTKGSANDSREV
jgi:hypothetical protein